MIQQMSKTIIEDNKSVTVYSENYKVIMSVEDLERLAEAAVVRNGAVRLSPARTLGINFNEQVNDRCRVLCLFAGAKEVRVTNNLHQGIAIPKNSFDIVMIHADSLVTKVTPKTSTKRVIFGHPECHTCGDRK